MGKTSNFEDVLSRNWLLYTLRPLHLLHKQGMIRSGDALWIFDLEREFEVELLAEGLEAILGNRE